MMGFGHGMGLWGWIGMIAGGLVVWTLLGVLTAVVYRLWVTDRRRTSALFAVAAGDRERERGTERTEGTEGAEHGVRESEQASERESGVEHEHERRSEHHAEHLLVERFAHGEIDEAAFRADLDALRSVRS